jgi:hypothetical protein
VHTTLATPALSLHWPWKQLLLQVSKLLYVPDLHIFPGHPLHVTFIYPAFCVHCADSQFFWHANQSEYGPLTQIPGMGQPTHWYHGLPSEPVTVAHWPKGQNSVHWSLVQNCSPCWQSLDAGEIG